MEISVKFTINGKKYNVDYDTIPIDTSLNSFIRNEAKLTGTKFMCLEGGCGACTVTVKSIHPFTKKPVIRAVNSCLMPVYSCHGFDILTVEGIGNRKMGYHPIQSRLANFNGSQCGGCSPGMVMNMYSLLQSKNGRVSMEEVENSFGGNICRCTGYRPILDAFKSFAADADPKLLSMCKDIEDLPKKCPRTNKNCEGMCVTSEPSEIPGSLHEVKEKELEWHKCLNMKTVISKIRNGLNCHDLDSITSSSDNRIMKFSAPGRREWYKVYRLADVLSILKESGDKPYMLVAGNTAHGVYRRSKDLTLFIDISEIDELSSFSIGAVIELGANMTLTDTMETLRVAAKSRSKFGYCTFLIAHIDKVAHVAVRNIGTLAGNLSIKHQHNEFPSDIFLIFETVGAKLVIVDVNGKSKTITLREYLNTDMNKKVIKRIILPAMDNARIKIKTYKVMPRAQNCHAIVNAGFLLTLNDLGAIVSATVCFGGIHPKMIHADRTEKMLVAKSLYNNEDLKVVLKSLHSEINPDWVLPDFSPIYRRNLSVALFYKFILSTSKSTTLIPIYKSGAEMLTRDISSGQQTYDTDKNVYPLTENIPKVEGLIQCAGEAEYVNDIPAPPHQLWGAFVIATEVQSKIIEIDADEALKLKGVRGFFSAKNIPGKNNFMTNDLAWGVEPEELFCSGTVLYNGQPVGIIVAETFEVAHLAATLVDIQYDKNSKKVFPTIFHKDDCLQANKEAARFTDEETSNDENLKESFITQGHFEIGGQYHFCMETQSCLVIPSDEGLDVYSATQWMIQTQIAISQFLNIPENKINVYVKRLGGAFGCKITRASMVSCACALAAQLTNRPVRMTMKIEDNMKIIGKRYPCVNDYTVESDSNGKITKLKNRFSEDYGCSLNEFVIVYANATFDNCYTKSNWDNLGTEVRTDSASQTFMRAPGSLEGFAMIENIMQHISKNTGKDSVSVRLANIDDSNPIKKYINDFLVSSDYYKRKSEIDVFNSQNRWRKRGIGLVPCQYPIGFIYRMHALVSIYHVDGTVTITHGGIESGQGLNTKAVQVAAHTLGLTLDMISCKRSNSIASPNDTVTGASFGSDMVALAVKNACDILIARMKPVKDANPNASWGDLTKMCFNKDIDLCAQYSSKAGDFKSYVVYGVGATEMEVDILTGSNQIKRVDILQDVGRSMSPGVDIGQVEGAYMMGVGYFLTEKLVYNRENGDILTNRTWNYKPPGAKDVPIDFRVTLLKNAPHADYVLRSKAIGEPPLIMAISVLFALRHALDSARNDAKVPNVWYHLGAPTTPEDVFLAAGNVIDQYKLN